MKGIASEVIWTAILAILTVMIICAMLVAFLIELVSGEHPMSYSIEFVDLTSRPYTLSGAISELKINDRIFLEHAFESSFAGSLEASDSGDVQGYMESFMGYYDVGYGVNIISGNETIMKILNTRALDISGRCGDELNGEGEPVGICVSQSWDTFVGTCNVGRLEIPQGENECEADRSSNNPISVCCKSVRIIDWNKAMWYDLDENQRAVLNPMGILAEPCDNYQGVCSMVYMTGAVPREECGPGMIELDSSGCEGTNRGFTPLCCKDVTKEALLRFGFHSEAFTPLFYKGEKNYISVGLDV